MNPLNFVSEIDIHFDKKMMVAENFLAEMTIWIDQIYSSDKLKNIDFVRNRYNVLINLFHVYSINQLVVVVVMVDDRWESVDHLMMKNKYPDCFFDDQIENDLDNNSMDYSRFFSMNNLHYDDDEVLEKSAMNDNDDHHDYRENN
jgi:hypothetical protein